MKSLTTAEILSTPQTVRLTQLISEAVAGFRKKFTQSTSMGPTDEEIDAFTRKVEPSIIESILKADRNFDTSKRDDRLKTVKALAAANGVKFVHNRETEEVEVDGYSEQHSDRSFTDVVDIELVNATRGGQTFAFKYALDEQNKLSINYVTAFCRADENFDPLIGMEESLKKFLSGRVLSTPIIHERFGPVKLDQLSAAYKEAEVIAQKILNNASKETEEAKTDPVTA